MYLAGVRCPILFLNGSNDFAYPLDSYQASYQLVDPRLRNVERDGIDRELFKVVYQDAICQLQVFGQNDPISAGGVACE